jgi:NADH:ubiquinone oxidoreductase subunit 3 (subunit A)
MEILLYPPAAFLIYLLLVLLIERAGKMLAGQEHPNPLKSSTYGGGEKAPSYRAAPGYRPFFLIAFFFAFLHLGMLIVGTGNLNWSQGVYLAGLIMALIALILG